MPTKKSEGRRRHFVVQPMEYRFTGLPERAVGWTLDRWAEEGDPKAAAAARKFVKDPQASVTAGTGLMFAGKPGTGKTLLASIIGMESHARMVGVRYLPAARFVQLCHEELDKSEDAKILLEKCAVETHLLILDDLGKEYRGPSGWAEHRIRYLLRERYDRMLSTVITTNCSMPQLSDAFDASLVSMLQEMCPLLVVSGRDHRAG